LIRRLCERCKLPSSAAQDQLDGLCASLDMPLPASARACEPVGCEACQGTGYRGRVGIFEVLPVTEAIEARILAGVGGGALRESARAEGMLTLREAGLEKVALGQTSIAEVVHHTIAPPSGAVARRSAHA
jgi:type IV pilus assembly protein PilB